jgi:hypothetical protein
MRVTAAVSRERKTPPRPHLRRSPTRRCRTGQDGSRPRSQKQDLSGSRKSFAMDSPLERNGFELPVPRQPPEVVFVSIHVRADFSVRGIKQRRHEPLSNPWWCHAAPMIRIRFPPAPSQKRTMRLPARLARIGRHDLDCRTAILVGTRPKLGWARRACRPGFNTSAGGSYQRRQAPRRPFGAPCAPAG